jgi:hypothetical protein
MLWWHAQTIVGRNLIRHTLARWEGPPLTVLRLALRGVHPVRGSEPAELIQAGYEAARLCLATWEGGIASGEGVRPLW